MDLSIESVQDLLDETARQCLRYMSMYTLTSAQNKRLAKFIFGCMNQKHEIKSRVERRGTGELLKVLRFITSATDLLMEIDVQLRMKGPGNAN